MAINKNFVVKHGIDVGQDATVTGNVTANAFIGDGSQLTGVSGFSGSYNDLTDKPTLFSGNYNDLANKPILFTGSYNDLTDKPTLFSGAYGDLTGLPTLFSGNYNDLSDKPVLATVATSGSYNDLTDKPNQNLNTTSNVSFNDLTLSGKITSGLNVVNPTSSYTVMTISGDSNYTGAGGGQLKIRNAAGTKFLEAGYNNSTLTGFLQVYNQGSSGPLMFNPDGGNITLGVDGFTTDIRTVLSLNGSSGTSGQVLKSNGGAKPSWLTLSTVATSGSYNDLTDKPTIPSLTGYATESYVNTQVANLVDSSPTTLDTLNELAAALGDDPNFATTVSNQIGLKANTSSLAPVAFNGLINSLNDVTISSPTTNQVLLKSAQQASTFSINNDFFMAGYERTATNEIVYLWPSDTSPTFGLNAFLNSLVTPVEAIIYVGNNTTIPITINQVTLSTDGTMAHTLQVTTQYNGPDVSVTDIEIITSSGDWINSSLGTVAYSNDYNDLTNKPFEIYSNIPTSLYDINANGRTIGRGSGDVITNTALGRNALYFNTTGSELTAVGDYALFFNTTGSQNTAVGRNSLNKNTIGSFNIGIGRNALFENTEGNFNSTIGAQALEKNTIGSNNTAIGFRASYVNIIGSNNTAIGVDALKSATGNNNSGIGFESGKDITTGSKNTLIGSFTGNSNGLDIRTSNNNIVLSDGDGWPGLIIKNGVGTTLKAVASGVGTHVLKYDPTTGDVTYDTPPTSFSGDYNDLTNTPTLGTAASTDSTAYATAAQGAKADTAVQPNTDTTLDDLTVTTLKVLGGSGSEGTMSWNASDGTLDLVMKGGNVVQQIGEEQYYTVRNETGSTIANGTPVMANGVTAGSGRITVTPAIANGSIDELRFIGLTTESITSGINGYVTSFGYVRGLDTRGTPYGETWAVGDIIYVSPTTAGYLTNVEPTAPNLKIVVAIVITRHQSNGVLLVRPTAYPHITHLSDVNILNSTNADVLKYDATTGVWKNAQLGAVAYSNNYNDLSDKPVIPTTTSQLTNDSGFITTAPKPRIEQRVVSYALTQGNSYANWVDLTDFNVTITPQASTSKILVQLQFGALSQSTNAIVFRLVRNGSVIAFGDASSGRPQATVRSMREGDTNHTRAHPTINYLDSPSTTNAVTYKIQWMCEGSATIYVNRAQNDTDNQSYGARTISTLIAQEFLG